MGISVEFDLNDVTEEIVGAHKEECERVALAFYEKVIEFTPVRTGRLRASWNISHTAPVLTLDPELERQHVAHFAKKSSGDELQDQESGALEHEYPEPTVPAKLEGLPDFPTIFVTNMQPYVGYVNDGSPTNEPHHMVERALQAVE